MMQKLCSNNLLQTTAAKTEDKVLKIGMPARMSATAKIPDYFYTDFEHSE